MMSPTMKSDTVSGLGFRNSNRMGLSGSIRAGPVRSGKRCAAAGKATTQQMLMHSKRFTLAMDYLLETMSLYFS